jgi:hypothetical protein
VHRSSIDGLQYALLGGHLKKMVERVDGDDGIPWRNPLARKIDGPCFRSKAIAMKPRTREGKSIFSISDQTQ